MLRQVTALPTKLIDRRLDRRGFSLEVVVVFLSGALGALGFGYFWFAARDALANVSTSMGYQFIGEVATPILLLFGVWLFYTIVAHVLAGHFRGRGPISRLFRTAAWALVPIGIWNLIRSGVIVYLFYDADLPANPDGLGASEQLDTLLAVGLESPIYAATLVLGAIFAVWSGYLLSVGVERAKGISRDDARKVAAVPSGIFALYLLWNALQWGGVL